MVKPKQLGHLVLRVRDAERSKAFYTDLLGLHVTFESPYSMVFMSAGESSHELALMALGPDAPGPDSSRVGMYHFAWEMESFEDLKRLKGELDEKDVRIVGIGDHGISMGVSFLDPDGNEMEAYYELPKEEWPKDGDLFGRTPFPLGSLEEEPAAALGAT